MSFMQENRNYIGHPALRGNKLLGPTVEKALISRDKEWLTELANMSKTSYSFMSFHVNMIRSCLKLPYELWDNWVDEYFKLDTCQSTST